MDDLDQPLAPPSGVGRMFTSTRRVRLGDVSPRGRLRLDSLTRYTQDASNDDTTDAGLSDDPGWVVRSTVVDELKPARYREWLTITTFCVGLGTRWADRRLTITGDSGARYEVSTLWVCVDAETGRPHRLTDEFLSLYGEAAAGREASARQRNPKLRSVDPAALTTETWQLRKTDFDPLEHVNNAAYWCAVEQWLGDGPDMPRRSRIEYGSGVEAADSVDIVRSVLAAPVDNDSSAPVLALWWQQKGSVAASATVAPLAEGLYP